MATPRFVRNYEPWGFWETIRWTFFCYFVIWLQCLESVLAYGEGFLRAVELRRPRDMARDTDALTVSGGTEAATACPSDGAPWTWVSCHRETNP